MAADKASTDWESIERDFRAGVLSIREIARRHGVTDAAIRKRAKRDGLVRVEVAKEKIVLPHVAEDEMLCAGFVYVIYIDSGLERIYKIGMAKRFDARFDQHQCASPYDICVAMAYFVANMRCEERALHELFSEKHVRGEWFRLDNSDLRSISHRCLQVSHV